MANLQVKNVPEALYRKIRGRAKRRGTTIREVVLEAVRREIEREEFQRRLETREPVELDRPAAALVDAERAARERELGS